MFCYSCYFPTLYSSFYHKGYLFWVLVNLWFYLNKHCLIPQKRSWTFSWEIIIVFSSLKDFSLFTDTKRFSLWIFRVSLPLCPPTLHSTTTSWYSVVCIIPLVERKLPSTNVHSFVLDSFSEMTQNKIPLLLVAHQEVLMFPLHFPSKPYSATKCLYDLGSTLFTIPGTHFYLSVFFLKCGS